MEKVIETKTCKHCSVSFSITDKDMEFYEKVSPIFSSSVIASETKQSNGERSPHSVRDDNTHIKNLGNGKVKYLIPTPTLCPQCRAQRRLTWRNETKLYKRQCDATGNDIISVYAPNSLCRVYDQKVWWSDDWDALTYGRVFDFGGYFFEQFGELFYEVPQQAVVGANNENSPYCQLAADNKNCYLISESSNNEDCYYGDWLQKCTNTCDAGFMHNCHECYYAESCFECFSCCYTFHSKNCTNSRYLYDCIDCHDCFGCVNLIGKSYHIFNVSYTPEDYKKEYMRLLHESDIWGKFLQFVQSYPKKYAHILHAENCSGDNIEKAKNCYYSFHAYDAEDCRYAEHVWRGAKDCMDVSTAGREAEKIYEGINCGISDMNMAFIVQCWSGCHDLLYCIGCNGSHHCFGCVGLKNQSYCILNKKYTKEEYEVLVPRIIGHMMTTGEWGEFFPSSLSPFGYNETVAQDYIFLTKEETVLPVILSDGKESKDPLHIGTAIPSPEFSGSEGQLLRGERFNWNTYESPPPKVDKIIPADKLPTNIDDIPDDILNWAIECEVTKKPFRITKQELEFYRKHNLPIPRRHPDQRHLDRMMLRNPRNIFERNCDKCGKTMQTTYAIERKEQVYCQGCYEKEVYGGISHTGS